jgi:ABC-type nitrate/sulfonate/bicarbonate transport system substrate-binding protein
MQLPMTRRRLLRATAGVSAIAAFSNGVPRRLALAADSQVRMTTLRAATHCMSWLGTEAGILRKYGVDVSFPKMELGATEVATGLLRGDWEFCHAGTLPFAEAVLNGGDTVILLRNTVAHVNQFVVAKREHTSLANLADKRVGVLSDVYSGQSGVNTRLTLEKAGVTATYVRLGTYQNIYAALAAGDIDAGTMPVHLRFSGERQHGWNVFDTTGFDADVPSVFATTRRLITSNRDLVMRVVTAYVETIHAFKTKPEVFVPLLQNFLNIDDRQVAQDLHRFYSPLFPQAPRLALKDGMQAVRDVLSKKYPAARQLQESDISDSSFIDQLDQSGFVRRLYGTSR